MPLVKTHKVPWAKNSLTQWKHDKLMLLETIENLCVSHCQTKDFFTVFFYFWVGRYIKTPNDWPHGNSEFCSPSTHQCSTLRLRILGDTS